MSSATLHLHVPLVYALPDGSTFDGTKIDVIDYAKELPNEGRIIVYGTLHAKEGPRARLLVIPLLEPLDLEQDLRERVKQALLAGDYRIHRE